MRSSRRNRNREKIAREFDREQTLDTADEFTKEVLTLLQARFDIWNPDKSLPTLTIVTKLIANLIITVGTGSNYQEMVREAINLWLTERDSEWHVTKPDPRLAHTGVDVEGRQIIDEQPLIAQFERFLEIGESFERAELRGEEEAEFRRYRHPDLFHELLVFIDRHGRQFLELAKQGAIRSV